MKAVIFFLMLPNLDAQSSLILMKFENLLLKCVPLFPHLIYYHSDNFLSNVIFLLNFNTSRDPLFTPIFPMTLLTRLS